MFASIDTILVPQGAEYRAVRRGLTKTNTASLTVMPIPIGAKALALNHQSTSRSSPPQVLLMGLCGALAPNYQVGDAVIYQGCFCVSESQPVWQECDRQLTTQLETKLHQKASRVRGLTSKTLVYSSDRKRQLGQNYRADVVDMEGFFVLKTLQPAQVSVAIIRVVSDRACQDLPNLSPAISASGSLNSLSLGMCLLKQPIAAAHLIQGSLRALQRLQHITTDLFA